VVAPSDRDRFWARALPALVANDGLADLQAEGDFAVLYGGSTMSKLLLLTGQQMRDKVISPGALTEARFEAAVALLCHRDFRAFGGAGIAVWGQPATNPPTEAIA
jgi:hypothetical protein